MEEKAALPLLIQVAEAGHLQLIQAEEVNLLQVNQVEEEGNFKIKFSYGVSDKKFQV